MIKPPAAWYHNGPIAMWMRALEPLYAAATAARRYAYRRHWRKAVELPIPVVVIGNLTVGGTGKTPLTIELVKRLQHQGWQPGVASRGYGRVDSQTPCWVTQDTTASQGGDEPLLIAWKTGAAVRVDRCRVAACQALVQAGCNIIVCDDGLQHYRLARDIEIEVIDGQRRYGNGHLLPAGPLREPATRATDCDFRVVNIADASPAASVGFGEWPMTFVMDQAFPLTGVRPRLLTSFVGQRVHAVAGIAHPERFFAMLRQFGLAVVPHVFPDHHRFAAEDFSFASHLPVLMTEKDAVKCQRFADDWFFSVPLQARLPEAFWVMLLDRIGQLRTALMPEEQRATVPASSSSAPS